MWSDIWDGVLNDALEAIPEGVEPNSLKSLSLYDWREKGAYHVTGATKRQFHLLCAADEFGGVITRDVEHLLDQAVQHRVLLQQALAAKTTPSQTWLLVTLYYLAAYLGLAWLRLTGKAIAYIGRNEIEGMRKLGSIKSGSKSPTNGTFVIQCGEIVGTRRALIFDRARQNNFHEALWSVLFRDFDERVRAPLQQVAGPETRFFSCLASPGFADGTTWPSRLRNLANYRVGFAYGGILESDDLGLLDAWPPNGFDNVLDIVTAIENLSMKVAHCHAVKMPPQYTQLLVYYTSLLGSAVEELRKEVWMERKISGQWQARRDRFLRHWNCKPSKIPWSFS